MTNPYPGLRPFEQNDRLFGRDEQVDELIRILKAERFAAVTGVSGSGKSSLIRAGVVPALIRGFLPIAQKVWKVAPMRPGTSPICRLRAALARVQITATEAHPSGTATDALENGGMALIETVKRSLETTSGPSFALFLLVDQFEDIFMRETLRDAASLFIALLSEATRH